MCTYKIAYSILLFKENNSLDGTNVVLEFDNRKEATARFYELVKNRLSSYSGYDLYHDSPEYNLPFNDKELEQEWINIKNDSNNHKRIFLNYVIDGFDKNTYDIHLHHYNYICQTAIGCECIHLLKKN